jgi:hypothetical protein
MTRHAFAAERDVVNRQSQFVTEVQSHARNVREQCACKKEIFCRRRREEALTDFGFRISDFCFFRIETPHVVSYKPCFFVCFVCFVVNFPA